MNLPDIRLNPHLDAALQRIRTAAEQAAERCAEGLGLSALSAGQIKRRDALLSAQFLFRKQQAVFGQHFHHALRRLVGAEQNQTAEMAAPRSGAGGKAKDWTELSLMDDDAVDALVAADRIGLAIGHTSEWELREVQSYVGGLQAGERNPLRPELIGQSLLEGVQAVSEDPQTREILTDEMTRAMAQEMRACYADIAELFRSRGLRPQDLRVRGAESRGGHSMSGAPSMRGEPEAPGSHPSGHGHGQGQGYGQPGGGRGGMGGNGISGAPGRGGLGVVDPQMMDLLRRLSQIPAASFGATAGYGQSGQPSQYGDFAAPGFEAASRGAWADPVGDANWQSAPLPPNLIHQHRDELKQAATGRLDHMVIDVVGSLFDQILSDPKVPPQMARLIARLQLPVLRVALGDSTFFSSRRHPVRRFVNRIASLACAFDDFTENPGKQFLAHVRDLVQDVTNGDFDRMDVYESKLDALETYIAEQTAEALNAQSAGAAELLARKETDLRLQQRYTQQLQAALAPVPMDDFLREFLAQVWSQAIVLASREGAPERALRLRQLGRELVMSVQPKAGSAARKAFLGELPILMRTLNEGLDLIAWPEPARKVFFGKLLPAHAESLKGQAPTALETNLLIKQLDQVFGCTPPTEQDLPQGGPVTVPQDLDLGARLSPAEARSLGLVSESGVDWNGQVDIELGIDNTGDEQALQAVDISIDGLPAVADAPEPNEGASLFDSLQLGFAYQMLTGDSWHKVRLAHISAGRSFFIFTQGHKHQETVTMTARMLKRLCEANRLKAFENSYLLERATARARKQLAALGSPG